MKPQSKIKLLSSGQYFPHCESTGAIGKALNKVNSSIWQELELVWDFMPVQIICKSHKNLIKTKKAMLRTRSNMAFFGTKGQVTLKWIFRSGRNSKSSRFYAWPSYLQVWRWFDQKWRRYQHFLHCRSMGKFFVAQGWITPKWIGLIWSKIELIWDFLDVLVSCMRKIWSKMKSLSIGQHCPHYKSMGANFSSLKGKSLQS